MDRYEARMTLHGNTNRDRNIWRLKDNIMRKAKDNPSYKNVKLNGVYTNMVINSGTAPYYKTFQALPDQRLKDNIMRKAKDNPSYKNVKLNGVYTNMVINSGTAPYYKTFQALPDQKVLPGDYIEWKDNVWLVLDVDVDDEVYIDGDLRQCNYELFWQKKDGSIVSRHAWVQNASAYNNGEKGNNYITLQSNQFMVYMPYDNETDELYMPYDNETDELQNGVRINMSRGKICKPYKLTRPDEISYGYDDKGVLNIIFTQTEFYETNDKLVELGDGTSQWICDYHFPTDIPIEPENPDNTQEILASISGNTNLKVGFKKTYSVSFKDKSGNTINPDFTWNIVSDFEVKQELIENKIKLLVEDEDFISSSFLLQIIVENTVVREIEITVVEGF